MELFPRQAEATINEPKAAAENPTTASKTLATTTPSHHANMADNQTFRATGSVGFVPLGWIVAMTPQPTAALLF